MPVGLLESIERIPLSKNSSKLEQKHTRTQGVSLTLTKDEDATKKVLVVEDLEFNRIAIDHCLEQVLGSTSAVKYCSNGQEAIVELSDNPT